MLCLLFFFHHEYSRKLMEILGQWAADVKCR